MLNVLPQTQQLKDDLFISSQFWRSGVLHSTMGSLLRPHKAKISMSAGLGAAPGTLGRVTAKLIHVG